MNPLQGCKFVQSLAAVSANGAYTTTAVDCAGFHYATVVLAAGLIGAADFTVAAVFGGDTSTCIALTNAGTIYAGTTAGAAVTGCNFIGTGSTPGDADDGKVWVAFIDLRRCTNANINSGSGSGARFIQFAGTSGAASLFQCLVILSNEDNIALTPAGWGAKAAIVI